MLLLASSFHIDTLLMRLYDTWDGGGGDASKTLSKAALRDGTRRVWVRVEPPHTLTRRPRSYPSPLPIPVNGYNFFPYPSPDRVDGYPRVKIPAFKTRKIGQKIVVKTTHNSCRRVIFHCFAISGVETWSRESDRLDIILGIAKLSV